MKKLFFICASMLIQFGIYPGINGPLLERTIRAVDSKAFAELLMQGISIDQEEKLKCLELAKIIIQEIENFSKDSRCFKEEAFFESTVCNAYVKREAGNLAKCAFSLIVGIPMLAMSSYRAHAGMKAASYRTQLYGTDYLLSLTDSGTRNTLKNSFFSYVLNVLCASGLCLFGVSKIRNSRPKTIWLSLYADACSIFGLLERIETNKVTKK